MSDGSGTASFVDCDDDARFAQLYRGYFRPVHDFCRRRLTSDLVDDAVAEVFATAWRRLDSVPPGHAALIWLYRVAYREVGHQWRGTTRRRRLQTRLSSMARRPAGAAEELAIDGFEHHLVLEAAARLGGRDAEVLRLAAWEELSPIDIAATLDITANAASQRLHRAKRNLAREYRRLEALQSPSATPPEGGVR
jgi:RNA polymerase sigma-70 factor (ECF subfamily)